VRHKDKKPKPLMTVQISRGGFYGTSTQPAKKIVACLTTCFFIICLVPHANAEQNNAGGPIKFEADSIVLDRISTLISKYGKIVVLQTVLPSSEFHFTINVHNKLQESPHELKATDSAYIDKYSIAYDMSRYHQSIKDIEEKLIRLDESQKETAKREAEEKRRIESNDRRSLGTVLHKCISGIVTSILHF
jgi:hypothetical protein